jgi:hypothetical protein
MDVATVIRRLNITDSDIIGRAHEYSRLLNAKLTSRHSVITQQSRNVLCVDIAIEQSKHNGDGHRSSATAHIDQSTLMKMSGASSAKHFAKLRTAVRSIIDVRDHVTLQRLTGQYGCFHILHDAQTLLTAYQSTTAPPANHIVPPSQTALEVSIAFVLVSVLHRAGVDRIALRNRLGVAERIWKAVADKMSAVCADVISAIRVRTGRTAVSAGRRSRRRKSSAVDAADTAAPSSKRRRRYIDEDNVAPASYDDNDVVDENADDDCWPDHHGRADHDDDDDDDDDDDADEIVVRRRVTKSLVAII